ncbi:MAG: trehalose-phosphatase [Chloroflexota bacterium]|nr:trehalose-phosphatase [Chloroflexota bacterium]
MRLITPGMRATLASRPLGLVFDIDGTLSPIAPTPGAARLYPGVAPLLAQLRDYAQVAIMTGRALADGAALVNVDDIVYIGNHGLESADGLPATHAVSMVPEAMRYVAAAKHLLDLVEEQLLPELPCILVQRKAIGGSVHYRLCPDPQLARQKIVALLAEPARQANLPLSLGKMVVDVQVPGIDKGTALRAFARRFAVRGLVFAGDDRTDLAAMREIAHLRQEGLAAQAIVVQHHDTLPELLAGADLVVQEVKGMYNLLQEIVGIVAQP